MSFLEALRKVALYTLAPALVLGLVVFSSSDDKESAFWLAIAFSIFTFLVTLFYVWSDRCPRCRKYLCTKKYKSEILSRDVVSKNVRDEKTGVQVKHYEVGKKEDYYECKVCKYKWTRICDYKNEIKV